jgi:hypothetical protein
MPLLNMTTDHGTTKTNFSQQIEAIVYDALQNQQENMEQPAVIILSEINNQLHLCFH